jgi:glycogen operon protein
VLWLKPDATEMTEHDWNFPEGRFLSYVLGPVQAGQAPIYIVLNGATETIEITVPTLPEYNRWTLLLNTAPQAETGQEFPSGSKSHAGGRSVSVFSGAA